MKDSNKEHSEEVGETKANNKTYRKEAFSIIMTCTSFVCLGMFCFYFLGAQMAQEKREYKVVSEKKCDYVILYNTSDKYVMLRCNINGKEIKIKKSYQKIINEADTEYQVSVFSKVTIEN